MASAPWQRPLHEPSQCGAEWAREGKGRGGEGREGKGREGKGAAGRGRALCPSCRNSQYEEQRRVHLRRMWAARGGFFYKTEET